jgi:hypothetical protein
VFYFLQYLKIQTTFHKFREANVSVKSADSIPALWRPQNNYTSHCPLNMALQTHTQERYMMHVEQQQKQLRRFCHKQAHSLTAILMDNEEVYTR